MYGCVMNQKKISVETELLLCVANTTRFERDSHIFITCKHHQQSPSNKKEESVPLRNNKEDTMSHTPRVNQYNDKANPR